MPNPDTQALLGQITSNQQLMAELQANRAKKVMGGRMQYAIRPEARDQYQVPVGQILQKYGVELPHDWVLHTDPNGQIDIQHLSWWQRNADWAIPLMIVGGGVAAAAVPALIGGGAAAGGGAGGAAGGGTAAATGGGTLASTTIGSGFVPSLVPGAASSLGAGGTAGILGTGTIAADALGGGAALGGGEAAATTAAATVPEAAAPGALAPLESSPLVTPATAGPAGATTLPAAPVSSLGPAGTSGVSAPLTGVQKYADIASKLSPVLSKAAEGRASGKEAETRANFALDQTALERTRNNNQALLDQMKAQIDAQNQYSKSQNQDTTSTQRGDLLANVQDVTATHPRANIVHYEGGIRPSALGPNAREAGRMLSTNALANMRLPAMTPPTLAQADPLTQKPNGGKSSLTDRLLSYGSLASGLSGLWRG